MLKEIVKAAKAPVKARILPQGEEAQLGQGGQRVASQSGALQSGQLESQLCHLLAESLGGSRLTSLGFRLLCIKGNDNRKENTEPIRMYFPNL